MKVLKKRCAADRILACLKSETATIKRLKMSGKFGKSDRKNEENVREFENRFIAAPLR